MSDQKYLKRIDRDTMMTILKAIDENPREKQARLLVICNKRHTFFKKYVYFLIDCGFLINCECPKESKCWIITQHGRIALANLQKSSSRSASS